MSFPPVLPKFLNSPPSGRQTCFIHPLPLLTIGPMWALTAWGCFEALRQSQGDIPWYDALLAVLIGLAHIWLSLGLLTLRLVVDDDGVECTDLFYGLWRARAAWSEIQELRLGPDVPAKPLLGTRALFVCCPPRRMMVHTGLLWRAKKVEAGLVKRVGPSRTVDTR